MFFPPWLEVILSASKDTLAGPLNSFKHGLKIFMAPLVKSSRLLSGVSRGSEPYAAFRKQERGGPQSKRGVLLVRTCRRCFQRLREVVRRQYERRSEGAGEGKRNYGVRSRLDFLHGMFYYSDFKVPNDARLIFEALSTWKNWEEIFEKK